MANCQYSGCALEPSVRDPLVGMVTVTASLSVLACSYIIVVIQAFQRCGGVMMNNEKLPLLPFPSIPFYSFFIFLLFPSSLPPYPLPLFPITSSPYINDFTPSLIVIGFI